MRNKPDKIIRTLRAIVKNACKKDFCVNSSGNLWPEMKEWTITFPWKGRKSYIMISYSKPKQLFRVHTASRISTYLEHYTQDKEEAVRVMEEYFSYILKGEIPQEALPQRYFAEKAMLDTTELQLEEIIQKEGLKLDEREILEQNGLEWKWGVMDSCDRMDHEGEWMWRIPLNYRNEEVYLFFGIDLNEAAYSVFPGTKAKSHSHWIELKYRKEKTSDAALTALNEYIQFAKQNKIPEEYLPLRNAWECQSCSMFCNDFLKKIIETVPIFTTLKSYVFRKGFELSKEKIAVNRTFCNCQESLSVDYACNNLEEIVHITDGKITRAESYTLNELPDMSPDDSEEEFRRKWKIIFTQHHTPIPGNPFLNIKRFENELKQLPEPEWQKDLQAVYDSNGTPG